MPQCLAEACPKQWRSQKTCSALSCHLSCLNQSNEAPSPFLFNFVHWEFKTWERVLILFHLAKCGPFQNYLGFSMLNLILRTREMMPITRRATSEQVLVSESSWSQIYHYLLCSRIDLPIFFLHTDILLGDWWPFSVLGSTSWPTQDTWISFNDLESWGQWLRILIFSSRKILRFTDKVSHFLPKK